MASLNYVLEKKWVTQLVAPALILVGPFFGWVGVFPALFGLSIEFAARQNVSRRLEQEEHQGFVRALVATTRRQLGAGRAAPENTLRANLMLYDHERGGMRIAYMTPGYSNLEVELTWQKGQGCSGRAWERGEPVYAPEDIELPVSVEDIDRHDRPWNMAPDQIRATAETLSSVLSVPVRKADDSKGQIVGMFNLDDLLPLEESRLGDSEVLNAAELVASNLGRYLALAGYDFPPETMMEAR